MAEVRIKGLERQLESLRLSKRKKVELDPNKKFASIEDIHKAQIMAGVIKIDTDKKSEVKLTSDEEDCIVVII